MRKTALLALAAVLGTAGGAGLAAKSRGNAAQASFSKSLPKNDRISHALNRLAFGPAPGDVERVRAMGLKRWIELQLHPQRIEENAALTARLAPLDTLRMSPAEMVEHYPPPQVIQAMATGRMPLPTDPERRAAIERVVKRYRVSQGLDKESARPRLNDLLSADQMRTMRSGSPQQKAALVASLPPAQQHEVLAALPQSARQGLFAIASPELRRRMETAAGGAQVIAQDLAQAKLYRAVYSNRQLEEVLVDFWYNHFNVFLDKGADRYLVTAYEEQTIRPRVLGKFKDLLLATAKSPAMLYYLDNWQSTGPAPAGRKRAARGLNENYGRELLELHTLGVDGGYTQKDVTEAARCFTGWTIRDVQRGGVFEFNPRMHDAGEKTVLGVKIPAGGGIEDGLKVIDLVASHPSTARFISRKLAQRFVADEPPEKLVARLAETFRKTDGDLRAVLAALFDSKEFWSVGAYRAKMKSPFELVASAVRVAGGEIAFAQPLAQQVTQLGQPLYRKLEPTGYSNSGAEWMNSAGLLARMNFAVQLAENRIGGVRVEAKQAGAGGIELGSPEFQKK
jgi:uncharacterized protein (DUF1800 family)